MEDQEIKTIAALARLDLKPEEFGKMKKNFSAVKGYIDLLSEIDEEKLTPSPAEDHLRPFRKDEPDAGVCVTPAEFSPYEEEGFFTVPKVIE